MVGGISMCGQNHLCHHLGLLVTEFGQTRERVALPTIWWSKCDIPHKDITVTYPLSILYMEYYTPRAPDKTWTYDLSFTKALLYPTELRRHFAHKEQRKGWDSNPRRLSPRWFSRPEPSTTRPPFQYDNHTICSNDCQVPPVGFEPTRISAVDFESTVSTVSPQGQILRVGFEPTMAGPKPTALPLGDLRLGWRMRIELI